jgi:hypothetical protein
MGSPPPNGSKKEVLKFRSNSSIVIPPAKTGNLRTSRNAVTQTLVINNGMLNQENLLLLRLFIVHRKLMDPAIELTPAKCNLKITKSTLTLECPK